MMTIWSARRGAWVQCPGPWCDEALAEAGEEERALDRQPLPRGDWSGNPATWARPHSQIGGDLPPFHPWLDFPVTERARRWAMGDRPENHARESAAAQRERLARADAGAAAALHRAARAAARDLLGHHEIVAVDVGRTEGPYPGFPGNAAVIVYVDGVFGDAEAVRQMLSGIDWQAAYGWPIFDVRPMMLPLTDCVRRGDAFARGLRSGGHAVGAFFYDPDLAKFGSASSPFVDLPYARAERAMQLPFADRYGPRLDAPTWEDWMTMGEPDPGWTCWTDPDTGVISTFPTADAARRAADGRG